VETLEAGKELDEGALHELVQPYLTWTLLEFDGATHDILITDRQADGTDAQLVLLGRAGKAWFRYSVLRNP
jgi:hypothetical protein